MSINQAKDVLAIEAEGILSVRKGIGEEFNMVIDLIMKCPSRLIISGIGKSGIIGQKISATMNSTGTPSFFLHPVEAMHGDLGMIDQRDVVLAISYSGETTELNLLLSNLRKRQVAIIAMTGNTESTMASLADVVLNVAVPREACPLGLAPTASTTAALAMGDALAVVLLDLKKFQASDFRKFHPGGSLGERLKVNVSEVMLTGEQVPTVSKEALFTAAVEVMNEKNLGVVIIIDDHYRLAGIITDGDVRRLVSKQVQVDSLKAAEVMNPAPKTIEPDLLAADALSSMQRHEITVLAVTDNSGRLAGILHLHDLLGKGEFRFML